MTHKAQGEVLTLEEAAEQARMSWRAFKKLFDLGDLPTTARPRRPGTRGPTARGVRRQDLDAWLERLRQRHAPPLPPGLHDLPVSVRVAARLTRYSKQHIMDEIHDGKLPARSLNLDDEPRVWQVKLGDLANWYGRPERWEHRATPRQFDAAILAQLEAKVQANEPPGNESGSTR